jgi:hypothetical protein
MLKKGDKALVITYFDSDFHSLCFKQQFDRDTYGAYQNRKITTEVRNGSKRASVPLNPRSHTTLLSITSPNTSECPLNGTHSFYEIDG